MYTLPAAALTYAIPTFMASLASPSQLISYKRDNDAIASHIGAKKVILQELDDLVEACAQAVPAGMTARKNE